MSKKLLAAALLPTAAFAQQPTQSDDLVITATRVEQPVSSVLAPTIVIDRAEIVSRQVQSFSDLLKTLPGVQIVTLGGRGHSSNMFVRGTNANHSLVLINGRQIASSVSGNSDLSQIPLGLVERIEYIRGPRAVAYGSDSIGGVINIITRTSVANGKETRVTGGIGSHGYGTGQLRSVQSLNSSTDGNLMVGYERTDGVDAVSGVQQPDRDGFNSINGQASVTHEFNDAWGAEVNALGWNNQLEYDGSSTNKNKSASRQLDGGFKFNRSSFTSRIDASYGENTSKDWSENQGEGSATPINTGVTRFSWINGWQANEDMHLTTGADWQREHMKSDSRGEDWSSGLPVVTAFNAPDRDNTGVFVIGSYSWNPVLFELSGRTDDNRQYGRHNTWSSALGVDIDSYHNVRLSYGTAFKAPSFTDLYYPGYENPNLKPEESKNVELSISGKYNVFDWSANIYNNKVDNLIKCQGVSSSCNPNNTNVDIEGVELAAGFFTGVVRNDISYDYTNAQDKNDYDRQLLRRAKQKATWLTSFVTGPFTWSSEALFVGKRADNDWNVGKRVDLGGYTQFNLGSQYAITNRLTLGGRIDNIFDKKYESAVGYPGLGTEFKLTVDYQL